MIKVQQHQRVRAVFKPTEAHVRKLKDGLEKFIGDEFVFYCGWIAEEDEQFPGQKIFLPEQPQNGISLWVPECDLEILEVLEDK